MKNLLICLTLFSSAYAEGAPSTVSTETVAAAFSYPREKLEVTDKTSELREKYGKAIRSAILFESFDGSFAPLQFLVTQGGLLLTDKLRSSLEKGGGDLQKLILEDGSVAYIGTEGFGPGAEGHVGIAHLEKENLDLKFKITISNDPPLEPFPGSETYQKTLSSAEIMHGVLRSLLTTTSMTITQQPSVVEAEHQSNSPPINPVRNETNHTFLESDVTRMASAETIYSKFKNVTGIHPGILGGCAIIALCILVISRKLKARNN